ncbi:MAG: bifunctional (p)ppGpp synthetase/guanosine-3',5'-bis(diphosphate) 3'-pyrophosphohydrolase [Clostridiales bacterium]|nr:bifunctional (p)ppGpp synthetase/guanosine-3',5'-bis(diphosphate) 3'-pyrophosphohydrolase [Candidatus Cacconaster stercorequi]
MNVVEEAIIFATEAHAGQIRKMANTPYILHPLEVAAIISTVTTNQDTIAAGVLHDTIEECDVDPRELKRRFGGRVAALVQSESEDKLSDKPRSETWMQRKEESLLMLQYTKDRDVKILWLGDKLSNIRSFYREYCKHGDAIWQGLHQKDPKMQAWYYKTIAEYLKELSDTAAYIEYTELVDKLFGEGDM